MAKNSVLDNIVEAINKAKTFNVVGHVDPDGDSNGSCSALTLGLVSYGKVLAEECDILFILDTSAPERIANISLVKKAKLIINLDHHLNNTLTADYKYVNEHASSCCEIVYELLSKLKVEITKEIANHLYTGITTDTGCFLYGNGLANSHKVASSLGADYKDINYQNFRSYSVSQKKLLQYALNKMELCHNGTICSLKIPFSQFIDDYHLVYRYICDLEGVKIGAIFIEKQKGIYSLSLRSYGDIDVSKICQKFGGGGHKNAAGAAITGSFNQFQEKVIEECKTVIDSIQENSQQE